MPRGRLAAAACLVLLDSCAGYVATQPWRAPSVRRRCCSPRLDDEGPDDLNWLQTRLQVALDSEDYSEAAAVRDRISRAAGTAGASSWGSLGIPDWLTDRLERLDFALPTRVQTHALRALERGDDAAVCAATGSGKTMAYLLPLLAQLSDDLLSEDLANYLASFLDGGGRAAGNRAADRRRARANSRGDDDGGSSLEATAVPTPAVLVVVPTRELGVQVAMIVYRLLGGGSTNPTLQPYTHPSRYKPGGKANMFSYSGPRHVKVAGLWDEQALYAAAEQDMLKGVHVIVGTPEYLSRGSVSGNLRLQHVRGVVIDEADLCLSDPEQAEAMGLLLRRMTDARSSVNVPPPQTVLAGASLSSSLVRRALDAGWVRAPTLVSEYGCIEDGCARLDISAADEASRGASRAARSARGSGAVGWTEQRVPAGHSHEYVVVEPKDSVAVLCRLLRNRFDAAANVSQPPPRVVVFAPSADAAVELAEKLQGALFGTLSGDSAAGLWGLGVLLPSAEARLEGRVDDDETLSVLESSLRVMELFAANRTSVLVTTAAATRGLDFPQVTDVLNLGIVGSPADYVHRAGRVGRVGQLGRGTVLSVLCPAEVPELLALGRELHFAPHERASPEPPTLTDELSLDEKVQILSETYYLFGEEGKQ